MTRSSQGIEPPSDLERFSHSDPGFTLGKYAHFLSRAGARGSAAIDAVFA